MEEQAFFGIMCLAIFLVAIPTANAEEVILSEDFELGIPPGWGIDNGVWELCMHDESNRPPNGGTFYVETNCNENYPRYTDSRLISPEIDLGTVTVAENEELHLRFWHWYSYEGGDYGKVQISVHDGEWSSFVDIPGAASISYSSNKWFVRYIDLTAYKDKRVKIAFYHHTDNDSGVGPGWFVDNVEVIKIVSELFPWNFEEGRDGWYAQNDVWEVGTPTSGPGAAHGGSQSAGTMLDGYYLRYSNSR